MTDKILSIEKFSPTKAELIKQVEAVKALNIIGTEDKEGYLAVDSARKGLKLKRVEIQKTGKELRADAIAFQKKVITLENELVALIEPVESELKAKTDEIDKLKEIEKRKAEVPKWVEIFNAINAEITEEEILSSNDVVLYEKLGNIKAEQSAERERKLREEQEKLEAERRKLEEEKLAIKREKQKQVELEEARKAEAERAKAEFELQLAKEKAEAERAAKQAEAEAKAKIEALEREKAEAEARAIREKQEAEAKVIREREAEEARVKAEAEKKEAEAKALAKKKKYQAFLSSHGYTAETAKDFILQNNGNVISLYKKIGEYNNG